MAKTEAKTSRPCAMIEVYVCPHPDCHSFYASSSAGDLAEQKNIRTAMQNLHDEDPSNWGSVTGTRIECQICKQQNRKDAEGKPIKREKVRYVRLDSVGAAIEAATQDPGRPDNQAKVQESMRILGIQPDGSHIGHR